MKALLIAATFALTSCASTDELFPVLITVQNDEGVPLEGLNVHMGQSKAGVTDALGHVRTRVRGKEGTSVSLTLDVPKGYKKPTTPIIVVLRRLERGEGEARKLLPVEKVIALEPTLRTYALLVRTGVPALPIELFGVQQAVTNQEGVAMFLYKGAPGDEVKVRFVTKDPTLSPQNPQLSIVLGPQSDAYVLREKFTLPLAPKARKIKRVTIHRL